MQISGNARRDGDARPAPPPVLSEAEFLARREAEIERVMVVRDRVRTEPPRQARYPELRCSKAVSSWSISNVRGLGFWWAASTWELY